MKQPEKKSVKTKTPGEAIGHQVRFDPSKFNELVFDKGYDVFVDKAMFCPCSVKNAGAALPNCNNCLGTGFFYINRYETRMAVQGFKADVRFENWSRDMTGMVKVTSRAVDRLSFMDRIVLQEVEGCHNEIIRTEILQGNTIKSGFTMYAIVEVESMFLFQNPKFALRPLNQGTDYTISTDTPSLINFSAEISNLIASEGTISVRYRHLQTYHMIDMNRDVMKVRTKKCCEPDEKLKSMPIMGMARKAHYMFDNPKHDNFARLIDNTEP